jgi:DNA-binding NtrC family response regulator
MARILIVEDDKDLNAAYKTILKKAGHNVESALNGKSALNVVGKFKPELILLDLLMPIMGGLEFLQNYNLDSHDKVKVVIFTNMENSPEVTEAYNLGATRCIIKSWTAPQNLTKIVEDVLARRHKVKN